MKQQLIKIKSEIYTKSFKFIINLFASALIFYLKVVEDVLESIAEIFLTESVVLQNSVVVQGFGTKVGA
jgi:hypothetical protein